MMDKKKKILVAAGIVVLILVLAYILLRNRTQALDFGLTLGADTGSNAGPATDNRRKLVLKRTNSWPLQLGSNSIEVAYLQIWLNRDYQQSLAVDGVWGPKTDQAFKDLWSVNMAFYGKTNLSKQYYDWYIYYQESALRNWLAQNTNIDLQEA